MTRSVLLVLALGACSRAPVAPPAAPSPEPFRITDDGFERMPPPKEGDWLHRFQEPGQRFDEYVGSCANRKSATRTTIYLQPMGTHDDRYRKAVVDLREYCEIFFGVPCKVLPEIELPEEFLAKPRDQYNSTSLIRFLEGRLPEDALVLAGVADKDLFSRGLNFVFGEGSLSTRCGVYSLWRYEHEPARFLWRGMQTLTHEIGHILSIEHCTPWLCVMNGSNSLAEGDRHPLHLCPEDLRKLQWNTGVDLRRRYERLREFYAKQGFEPEAAWVAARLK